MSSEYGYVRVSTKEQHEDRQIAALVDAGIAPDMIYVDKASGKDFDRAAYQKMKDTIMPGDVIFIKSIDRLGRNYAEIQEQWGQLTKQLGVDIVVLDMPLLDTRRSKDLLGTFVADLTLQILSFVAQMERDAIRQRQAEGYEAARARGVHLGRPLKPLPEDWDKIYRAYKLGGITQSGAARVLGMPLSTFRDAMKRYDKEQEEQHE